MFVHGTRRAPGETEHVVHHPRRQLAGVRVLPAGVVTADQGLSVRELVPDAMAERRSRPDREPAAASAVAGRRRTRSFPARRRCGCAAARASSASRCTRQLTISSGVGLLSGGAQRAAAVMKTSCSVRPSCGWREVGMFAKPARCSAAIRKSPRAAGAVAGEHAAGAVGAVRGRRQRDQQHPRVGIAEARDRLAPVDLVAVRFLLRARDFRAVARAAADSVRRKIDPRGYVPPSFAERKPDTTEVFSRILPIPPILPISPASHHTRH